MVFVNTWFPMVVCLLVVLVVHFLAFLTFCQIRLCGLLARMIFLLDQHLVARLGRWILRCFLELVNHFILQI